MFALEIHFQDGVSQPETIFVRRPQALIGASDYAHVVVEDMRSLDYQVRLVRDLGRTFRCRAIMSKPEAPPPAFSDEIFEGVAALDLGPVRLQVTAVDSDLTLKENEAPDRAGVRILRQAIDTDSPLFPAVVVRGPQPLIMSFPEGQSIYIGRSKQCALRLDAADISARHARFGFEDGEFWIEDLGSTNGTFVDNQQISARAIVPAGVPIFLGREISILGVTGEDQIGRAAVPFTGGTSMVLAKPDFPVLVSLSPVARPARLVLKPGTTVRVGRDPASEMWIGAPHVSRLHCAVAVNERGDMTVSDHSTNGTAHAGGVLHKGDLLDVGQQPRVFDLGGGVTVGLCFSTEEEHAFRQSHGNPRVFVDDGEDPSAEEDPEMAVRARRQTAVVSLTPLAATGGLGWQARFAAFYSGVSSVGRLAIVAAVIVLAMVTAVVVQLLIPVFR